MVPLRNLLWGRFPILVDASLSNSTAGLSVGGFFLPRRDAAAWKSRDLLHICNAAKLLDASLSATLTFTAPAS